MKTDPNDIRAFVCAAAHELGLEIGWNTFNVSRGRRNDSDVLKCRVGHFRTWLPNDWPMVAIQLKRGVAQAKVHIRQYFGGAK